MLKTGPIRGGGAARPQKSVMFNVFCLLPVPSPPVDTESLDKHIHADWYDLPSVNIL